MPVGNGFLQTTERKPCPLEFWSRRKDRNSKRPEPRSRSPLGRLRTFSRAFKGTDRWALGRGSAAHLFLLYPLSPDT